jgi:glucosamine--fructose-6-phosphate aminotransferase (isomerizing)
LNRNNEMLPQNALGKATFRETRGQVGSCEETIQKAAERLSAFESFLPLDQYTHIVLTGCGSSYNLAKCGAFAWSEILERPVQAIPASELIHFSSRYLPHGSKVLLLAVSRTGATSEVRLAVHAVMHDYDAKSIAFTLRSGSDVGAACDLELAFPECYEESVVMTRAFTSILTAVYLLADGATGARYQNQIAKAPALIEAGLLANEDSIRTLATLTQDRQIERFFFLGSGAFKGLADESALKVTEMALLCSASYHSLEFRHGPIAALDKKGVVVLFPAEAELPYMTTLLGEIAATGARAFPVTTREIAAEIGKETSVENLWVTDSALHIPEFFRPAIFAYVGHLIGYWAANAVGVNPDRPRNLERTVFLNA